MRRFFHIYWIMGLSSMPLALYSNWETEYAALLDRYVSIKGVDYNAWHTHADSKDALRRVVMGISAAEKPQSRDAQLAFYINAYNAWMLHFVLEAYPIHSVKNIGNHPFAVFNQFPIVVHGEHLTLDRLEKEWLLKALKEPRVHFAVNCASRSCPPLRSVPYTEDRISQTLDKQTHTFLNSSYGVEVDASNKRIKLSKLFEWYAADFEPVGGSISFIQNHLDIKQASRYTLTYMEYDWALNASHRRIP